MTIRPERPDDRAAIRAVLQAAFPTSAEADLVDILRDHPPPMLSLVAEVESVVLGYPTALLPLPALICAAAMGVMALIELVSRTPLDLGHSAEME